MRRRSVMRTKKKMKTLDFVLKLSTLEIPFFDLELLCRHTDLFHGGEEFLNCDERQLRQFSLMFLKVRAQH